MKKVNPLKKLKKSNQEFVELNGNYYLNPQYFDELSPVSPKTFKELVETYETGGQLETSDFQDTANGWQALNAEGEPVFTHVDKGGSGGVEYTAANEFVTVDNTNHTITTDFFKKEMVSSSHPVLTIGNAASHFPNKDYGLQISIEGEDLDTENPKSIFEIENQDKACSIHINNLTDVCQNITSNDSRVNITSSNNGTTFNIDTTGITGGGSASYTNTDGTLEINNTNNTIDSVLIKNGKFAGAIPVTLINEMNGSTVTAQVALETITSTTSTPLPNSKALAFIVGNDLTTSVPTQFNPLFAQALGTNSELSSLYVSPYCSTLLTYKNFVEIFSNPTNFNQYSPFSFNTNNFSIAEDPQTSKTSISLNSSLTNKINIIDNSGDGSKYLADNGVYKTLSQVKPTEIGNLNALFDRNSVEEDFGTDDFTGFSSISQAVGSYAVDSRSCVMRIDSVDMENERVHCTKISQPHELPHEHGRLNDTWPTDPAPLDTYVLNDKSKLQGYLLDPKEGDYCWSNNKVLGVIRSISESGSSYEARIDFVIAL